MIVMVIFFLNIFFPFVDFVHGLNFLCVFQSRSQQRWEGQLGRTGNPFLSL